MLLALQTGTVTLENSVGIPQNLIDTVTILARNSNARYTHKRSENICSYKNLYVNVHNRIVHNNQKVETNQMSIS